MSRLAHVDAQRVQKRARAASEQRDVVKTAEQSKDLEFGIKWPIAMVGIFAVTAQDGRASAFHSAASAHLSRLMNAATSTCGEAHQRGVGIAFDILGCKFARSGHGQSQGGAWACRGARCHGRTTKGLQEELIYLKGVA